MRGTDIQSEIASPNVRPRSNPGRVLGRALGEFGRLGVRPDGLGRGSDKLLGHWTSDCTVYRQPPIHVLSDLMLVQAHVVAGRSNVGAIGPILAALNGHKMDEVRRKQGTCRRDPLPKTMPLPEARTSVGCKVELEPGFPCHPHYVAPIPPGTTGHRRDVGRSLTTVRQCLVSLGNNV